MAKFTTTNATYKVTLTHPTNFHNAPSYDVKVTTTTEEREDGELVVVRRCDNPTFGCSRDYYDPTDKGAIAVFLREHLCTLVKATKKPAKK